MHVYLPHWKRNTCSNIYQCITDDCLLVLMNYSDWSKEITEKYKKIHKQHQAFIKTIGQKSQERNSRDLHSFLIDLFFMVYQPYCALRKTKLFFLQCKKFWRATVILLIQDLLINPYLVWRRSAFIYFQRLYAHKGI